MNDALVAGDYGKACDLDPENEELQQLRDLTSTLGEKPTECIKTIAVGSGSVKRVSISSDGQSVAYVLNGENGGGTVGIVDVTSDPSPKTIFRRVAYFNSVAFSPDGNLIGVGGNSFEIGIWDLASQRQTRSINTEGQSFRDSFFVDSVTFSPDSKLVAACGKDNLEIWNVVTGTKVQTLTRHSDDVACVKFSTIGGVLASGHDNGTIKIWDVASGACSKTLKEHQEDITSLAFSQDGKRLVSASRDRSIKLWNLDTGQSEKTFAGEGFEMTVDININGNWIVNNSSRKIQIWDIESGACTELSDSGSGGSECVAFSPDGKTAISGTSKGNIKIWDVESPVAYAKLSSEIDKLSKKVMDEFLDTLD